MASTFPTTLDALSNPAGTDTMSAHADQHGNANDAIEAIEARIGVTGTAVAGTVEKRLVDVIAAEAATALVAAAALPSAGLVAALTAANVVTTEINGVTGGIGILGPDGKQMAGNAAPYAFTSRALTDADNGMSLKCASAQVATVNIGLAVGFGCAFKGAVSFSGSATVTDVRTTGATNPWCALMNTGVDTYDAVGSKA